MFSGAFVLIKNHSIFKHKIVNIWLQPKHNFESCKIFLKYSLCKVDILSLLDEGGLQAKYCI